MTREKMCIHCGLVFEPGDRVIYSEKQTFIFKPANIPDVKMFRDDGSEINAAAVLSPEALAETRKDHTRTTVGNVFVDWGKAEVPEGAFRFRHQWCEPIRTASTGQLHNVNKHAIRFSRRGARRG